MDITADGKFILLASRWARKLTVIDIAARKVAGLIDLGESPEGVYRSPDGKLFATGANAGFSFVPPDQGRYLVSLAVIAVFAVPLMLGRLFEHGLAPFNMALVFGFYLCQAMVIHYFNAALVGAAQIRLAAATPEAASSAGGLKGSYVDDTVHVAQTLMTNIAIEQALKHNPHARILVLERGGFVLPVHYQMLPMAFQAATGETVAKGRAILDRQLIHRQVIHGHRQRLGQFLPPSS